MSSSCASQASEAQEVGAGVTKMTRPSAAKTGLATVATVVHVVTHQRIALLSRLPGSWAKASPTRDDATTS
jgi:hypothetical protein